MHRSRVVLDTAGFYYSLRVTVGKKELNGVTLACAALCEERMRRPHLTCLWCRTRRVYYGKMASKTPVDVIVLSIQKRQKYKVLKALVRKLLLTLVGWTLN